MLEYVPIIILFILFLIRIPVALAILIATLFYFTVVSTTFPVQFVIQRTIASTQSFPYLAIPFFVCAGVVFNYAGITSRLITLAEMLVGHLRGGMGHVNIVMSTMLGGLSGSANADAAMLTKILVPEMRKIGYSRGYAAAMTAASSCITPIIPPGIILILYALIAQVSVAKMFFAGILPGLLICILLMITVGIVARVRQHGRSRERRADLKAIGGQILDSVWALILPVGILGGLRIGIFTPTEAGAVSVFYAVVVGAFIYRKLKWSHLPKILYESVTATAAVMIIIAAALAFGHYLTWEGIPSALAAALIENIHQPLALLAAINFILLIVGCFFEGGAAMILLAPIFVPTILQAGIDPIYFGIVMSINLTIAGFTPPFGTMMFVTTSVAEVPLEEYIRECWPFLLALLAALVIVTLIPTISLLLPNLFYG